MIELTQELIDAVHAADREEQSERSKLFWARHRARGRIGTATQTHNDFAQIYGQRIYELRLKLGTDTKTAKELQRRGVPTAHRKEGAKWSAFAVRGLLDTYVILRGLPIIPRKVRVTKNTAGSEAELRARYTYIVDQIYLLRRNGQTLGDIVAAFNDAGTVTPTGKLWTIGAIRSFYVYYRNLCTQVQKYRPRPARRTGPRNEHHIG